jgi:hypothetical protein
MKRKKMQQPAKTSIQNVLVWSSLLCLVLLNSGCALFKNPFAVEPVKPVEVVTKAQERLPLNLPDPEPLVLSGGTWMLITPENATEVWRRLEDQKQSIVLFALTAEGYERLAMDIARIRNFIQQQREITNKYRNYYEPKK